MPDEPFGPFDRIDSRLTILNWPADPPQELVDAVGNPATFEIANSAASVLPGADGTTCSSGAGT
jgi:hypothetical protein